MALSEETSFRLIGGGGTRGLSGDADRVLAADPALDFFNACLRRHKAAGDLLLDPDQLWRAEGNPGRLGGLASHLQSASRERVAGLSDILVVVNAADWQRAARQVGVGWGREAVETLKARFHDACTTHGLRRHNREVGVRLLADGSGPMQGKALGLGQGEFVTGILPNQYDGPSADSRALVAVHLNLPGGWPGYREVARLHHDQDLLTIGNHWLDNYAHPALSAPAIYRLQWTPEEGLVHLVSPDTDGRFQLHHHADPGGPSVYALQRTGGEVLAWLVLAVIDEQQVAADIPASSPSLVGQTLSDDVEPVPVAVVVEESPTLDPGPMDRDPLSALPTMDTLGEPGLDTDDPPAVAEPAPEPAPAPASPPATLAAAGMDLDLLSLRELGVLLQRVHFRDIMLGYEIYIGAGGEIGTRRDSPMATIQVIDDRVRLVANAMGVLLGAVPIPPGAAAVLGGESEIRVGDHRFAWRDLRAVRLRGWPYLGELRRRGGTTHLVGGTVHAIGRALDSRVQLPDDPHNNNILWRPEVDAGAVIRAKNGDVPKSRFTLDSIMVATHHLELDLTEAQPRVRSVARHCYSFIRRETPDGERIISLSRAQRVTGEVEALLEPGDDLLVGNCVFELDWSRREGDATDLPMGKPPPVVFTEGATDDEGAVDSLVDELDALPPLGFQLPPPPPVIEADPTGLPEGPPPPLSFDGEDDSMAFDPVPTAGWRSGASVDATDDPTGLPGRPPPPVRLDPEPTDDSIDEWSPFGTLDDFHPAGDDDPTGLPGEGPPPPLKLD